MMDKTTLEDQAVTSALAGYVKVKFQAENPDDPKVARVMQKLDSKGCRLRPSELTSPSISLEIVSAR